MKHSSCQTILAFLVVGCALGSSPVLGAPVPFDYAVRARSTLSTGGNGVVVDDRTFFDSATSAQASGSFVDNSTGRNFSLNGQADLSSGALRVQNQGTGGPGGNQTGTATFLFSEYLDTLRFSGDYTNTPLLLPFTATYDGTWTGNLLAFGSNPPGVQIFTWLWFADASKAFTQDDWLNTGGLFSSGGELEKHVNNVSVVNDGTPHPVHIQYSGTLSLNGVNPILRAWQGLEADVYNESANGSWNGDFAHTATLTFDFTGLNVTSASGVFPGTGMQPIPEPAALTLFGLALAGLACARKRAS